MQDLGRQQPAFGMPPVVGKVAHFLHPPVNPHPSSQKMIVRDWQRNSKAIHDIEAYKMTTTEEQHHLIQKRLTWVTKVFNFSTSSALNCITRSRTALPGKTHLLNILSKILFNWFRITTFGVSSNMEQQNEMSGDAIYAQNTQHTTRKVAQ